MNKDNMKMLSKKAAVTTLALSVLVGAVVPVALAGSASFNTFSADKDTTRVSHTTGDPGCSTCWESSVSGVEEGDTVAVIVYYHNTGPDTAEDTRVRVQATDSTGDTLTFNGRVWADNASAASESVTVNMKSGHSATGVKHIKTSWYPDRTLSGPISMGSGVTGSNGISIGDITFSWDSVGHVVVLFEVLGDDDENGGGGDLEVTTLSAINIDEDSARLRCDVETGDADAQVWFEWGEDDDDLDEETNDVDVNNNTDAIVTRVIDNLDPDTQYFFRCVAEDDDGDDDEGTIRSFRTDDDDDDEDGDAPDVTTLSATGVTAASAVLRGDVDPNGEDTDAWFEWGTSSNNLNRTTSRQDMGDGTSDVLFTAGISGLSANTTYFYRAVAENDEGDDEGQILSFTTGSVLTNVITRFIDVIREVEPEPEVEALIITLEANAVDIDRRVIDYTVSYENNTDMFLTDVVLTVDLPRVLEFVDADPNPDDDFGDQLVFEIGRVEAGEQDSFLIETELDSSYDVNDTIRFVATVEYNDDGSARKVVEVIDESTFGELARAGGFTAAMIDAFRALFTNPLLWIILFILLVVLAARYLLAARERKSDALV